MLASAIFLDSGRAEVIETDEPKIATPNDVRLRVLDVGICGADRSSTVPA